PRLREPRRLVPLGSGELKVAGQRLEHVLPRTHGIGFADLDRLAALQRADAVGDDAGLGPVAATDDVAGAGGGEADAVCRDVAGGEEALAVRGDDQLRAAL